MGAQCAGGEEKYGRKRNGGIRKAERVQEICAGIGTCGYNEWLLSRGRYSAQVSSKQSQIGDPAWGN